MTTNPYLDYEWHVDESCRHDHQCPCFIIIQGKGECSSFRAELQWWRKDDSVRDAIALFSTKFGFDGVSVVPGNVDMETLRFLSRVPTDANIKFVPAPPIKVGFPLSLPLIAPNPLIRNVFKRADMRYMSYVLGRAWDPDSLEDVQFFEENIWTSSPSYCSRPERNVPVKLQYLLARPLSLYNAAFGLINGRPTVVSAMADLYPSKYADTVLKQVRRVHVPHAGTSEAWAGVNDALRIMYHHFGTADKIGKLNIPFTLADVEGMPLGTSGGLNKDVPRSDGGVVMPAAVEQGNATIKISASAKKYENVPTDLHSIIEWLLDPNAPDLATQWNTVPKNENLVEFIKQLSDPEWDLFTKKLRTYVIPSSLFVLMERLVSKVRFRLERGKVIQVGHGHSRGGADRIAKRLRINLLNEMKPILVEGDVKNFDQSVWEQFVDLYYSHGMVYDKPGTPEFTVRSRITRFLIRAILCRLTHMFGAIWAIQTGGVPSGVLNTSHMDSWVMALWFFLFGVHQIKHAPPEHKELLETAILDMVALIVYGDDHVWNKTDDAIIAAYFSGHNFARFMKAYFGVEIRGIKDGVTFLSDTYLGMVIRWGVTFLRHQFVRNPFRNEPGQCQYLPFRESREYFARVAWGKESRERGYLDVILSCLGHAYGTYGSNVHAWWGLRMIYIETIKAMGLEEVEALHDALENTHESDFKEMRRKDISREDILRGFPSLETLKKKNIWDPEYHDRIASDDSVSNWDFDNDC